MNENEIERLLNLHADSLGPCATPQLARRKSPWGRRLTFGIAGLSVVLTIGIAMWPRDVAAKTLARVRRQILDANSLEERIYMKIPSGWHEMVDTYYAKNMRRIDSGLGSGTERNYIERDGRMFLDFKRLDFATVFHTNTNHMTSLPKDGQSVLDIVKDSFGGIKYDGVKRTTEIRPHEPVKGHQTYLIAIDQPADDWHLQILVDKATDFPIQSELRMPDRWKQPLIYRSEIRVNPDFDPNLFEFPSTKQLVSVPEDLQTFSKKWTLPISQIEGTEIRNVTVAANGTVWVASTTPHSREVLALPTTLTDDHGTEYVLNQDVDPAGMAGRPEIQVFDRDLYVTSFVPVSQDAPLPTRLTLGFSERAEFQPFFSESLRTKGTPLPETLSVTPQVDKGDWPSYFRYLGIPNYVIQVPGMDFHVRAKALEQRGNLLLAAQAYERYADFRLHWVKYSAFAPLLDAARLYKKLGNTTRADELTKQAEALKESRER